MITTAGISLEELTDGLPHQHELIAELGSRIDAILKPTGWHRNGDHLTGPTEPTPKQRTAATDVLRAARALEHPAMGECDTLAAAACSLASGPDAETLWTLVHQLQTRQ